MLRLVSVLFLFTACSGNAKPEGVSDTGLEELEEQEETGDGEEIGDTGALLFQPVEGDWVYSTHEILVDDCNMGTETMEASSVDKAVLELVGSAEFSISHRQGDEVCTLSGQAFTCNSRQDTDSTPQDYGIDALMILTFGTLGSFSDTTTMDLEVGVSVECVGDGCWLIETAQQTTMPCRMVIGATLTGTK